MEQNVQRKGLVTLLLLLAGGAVAYGAAHYSNALAGQVAAVFLGIGALVAFVSWFQMRLEDRERIEKLEFDELARSRGSATLFEGKDTEVFPAQRSREQFEKYFVPAFVVVLFAAETAAVFSLWRWLNKFVSAPMLKQEMAALSILGLLALFLFIFGRFFANFARLENHRLLRPSANHLLLGAYLCVISALAIAGVKGEFVRTDLYVARGLVILLGLVALETAATLIFEIYRPRLKGKVVRPLYDSRFVGLLAQPEGLVATAAQTLDYQFGFKVSETWFFQTLKQYAGILFLMQLGVLLLSTCVVFIDPGEQALLERFGKSASAQPLGPGAHLKLPWPIDKVYRYHTEEIHTLPVGFTPEEGEEDHHAVLWTSAHTKEENFLVAARDRVAIEAAKPGSPKKAPPVSMVTGSIPVQYQISDLLKWQYNHEDSSNLLQQISSREVVRFLVSVDLNEIMSNQRLESAVALRDSIQAAADAQNLGAKILFVGLQDIHPPVKVAPDYEKVVSSIHLKQSKILAAQGEAIRTNLLAGAQAYTLTNAAEAARIGIELTATARAAAFTNQIPAFNAAPSVYRERLYLQSFAQATAKATKYVLLATNTSDVIQFDLQRRVDEDIFNRVAGAVAAPKK